MTRHRWFLPATPDVLGKLQAQTAITMGAMEALVAWSVGEAGAADRLRECEHRADECKRELRAELTVAFTTSLEPEDIFALSTELDRVLNGAKNAVREAEVMEIGPDEAISAMTAELAEGMRDLSAALEQLAAGERAAATEAADRAANSQSRVEKVYRHSMSALVAVVDPREVAAKRELYRRLARTSDDLREVAERVWYSVLKEG